MQPKEKRLTDLESLISVNQPDFYAVGIALQEIRQQRLYKLQQFDCFASYLQKRWDMGRCYAYRLIAAAKVIDHLSPIGDILPKNEAQARPLTKLEPFEQTQVWRAFIKSYDDFSAHTIRQFLKDRKPHKQSSNVARIALISSDYNAALETLLHQIQVAKNDRWQSTSQEAALHWNQIMKEKILWKKKNQRTNHSH